MDVKELTSLVTAYQRGLLEDVIRFSGGNVTKAARELGIDRSNLYKRLSNLGVDLPAVRAGISEPSTIPNLAQKQSS